MKASDINRVVVIGAGTMGAGVAGLFARAGCEVRLLDQSAELVARGLVLVRESQAGLRAAKTLSARAAAAALRRIHPCLDWDAACADVELAVEAISENMPLKQAAFRRLDALCPRRAVLASNTSGLSITALAAATTRPKLVAGMHFWNPPHLIPLVEVVRGRDTAPATAKLLTELSLRLGKRPILVERDVPGFVGNRLQFAVLREALHLLATGVASAADIDAAMSAGPGLRYGLLGPLKTADLGGLDVFLAISRYLFPELSAAASPPPLLSALVEQGNLGVKSGRGFYAYGPRDKERLLSERDRVLSSFVRILPTEKR